MDASDASQTFYPLISTTPIKMILSIVFIFCKLTAIWAASLDSPCADQLQRCGLLVEEFERQLSDLKNQAFRRCFTNTACVHEKIAFDDCFMKSMQAIRAPFGDNPILTKNDFLTAAEDYRHEMESCFSDPSIGAQSEKTAETNETGTNEDEDVSYLAHAIFGTELVDQLWGLPNGELGKGQVMDPQGGCANNKQGANDRVFGGGISRIVPQGTDQLNNLNTSCTLSANEIACFRRALSHDPQYKLLMTSRDRALRSCIQNARLQSEINCQFGRSAQLQTCVCHARDELDARMQSAILNCVQQSPVAQLYSALVSLSSGESPVLHGQTDARFKPISTTGVPLPGTSFQVEEPVSMASTGSVLTQGSIVSGQCLCACPQKATCSSSILANNDYNTQTKARLPTTDTAAVVVPANTQIVANQPAYRAVPWYYQPLQTALSTEAGIANGFERFFNGQLPLRRKKRGQRESANDQMDGNNGV